MYFAESELIINPDGSIYHLHLRPEEIADTIITVGDQDRVAEVSKYFDRIEFKTHKREFVTHTGYVGKKRISVLSTGIGTDNIDIVWNELDALVNIDFETRVARPNKTSLQIIRIGTSGSLQEDLPVDSFLVSTGGMGLDNLLHFYGGFERTGIAEALSLLVKQAGYPNVIPYYADADTELLEIFAQQGFETGITASCPGFYAPQGRQINFSLRGTPLSKVLSGFRWNNQRITNLEMETSAMYGLSKILGHRSLSCNAILANRVTNEFSKEPQLVVDRLIRIALERIELM
jgi:uridine phosphorylase